MVFRSKNKRGFSLIELTVVLALMSIMVTMFVPLVRSDIDRRFAQLAANELHWLMNAAKHARNHMMNSGNAIWLDFEEMKSTPSPYIPVAWNILNPYGNPYILPDFESNKPAAQTANVYRIRTKVIPSVRDYMLKMVPFAVAIGDDEIEVATPVGGAEPGWSNKMSIYENAPPSEMTAQELATFVKGIVIDQLKDLDDNNYNVDPNQTTHLHRLIVDEFEVSGNSIFSGPVTMHGDLTLDDLICNNLTVLQNTSANIGSWQIYGGNLNDVGIFNSRIDAPSNKILAIQDYGEQPANLIFQSALKGRD